MASPLAIKIREESRAWCSCFQCTHNLGTNVPCHRRAFQRIIARALEMLIDDFEANPGDLVYYEHLRSLAKELK